MLTIVWVVYRKRKLIVRHCSCNTLYVSYLTCAIFGWSSWIQVHTATIFERFFANGGRCHGRLQIQYTIFDKAIWSVIGIVLEFPITTLQTLVRTLVWLAVVESTYPHWDWSHAANSSNQTCWNGPQRQGNSCHLNLGLGLQWGLVCSLLMMTLPMIVMYHQIDTRNHRLLWSKQLSKYSRTNG